MLPCASKGQRWHKVFSLSSFMCISFSVSPNDSIKYLNSSNLIFPSLSKSNCLSASRSSLAPLYLTVSFLIRQLISSSSLIVPLPFSSFFLTSSSPSCVHIQSYPSNFNIISMSLAWCTPLPQGVGLSTNIISFNFACILNNIIILIMFKKVAKKTGTARTRDDEHHTEDQSQSETPTIQDTNDEELKSIGSGEVRSRQTSRFALRKQVVRSASNNMLRRRGSGQLVHQGSYQAGSSVMGYTQSEEVVAQTQEQAAEEEIINTLSKPRPDIEMIDVSEEHEGEDESFMTEERKNQIKRLKELRQQKRKLEGTDYIPFDESTSGGKFSKDQIHGLTNRMDSLEAQMLKTQLIKERYQTSESKKLPSLSQGIIDSDHANHIEEEEDEEEVEAFIKKRVKEGAGRDYEAIVKKDIVSYQRLQGQQLAAHGSSEYAEINKYENSKAYKMICSIMEIDNDNQIEQIEAELSELQGAIKRNQGKIQEMKAEELKSKHLIEEADLNFQKYGQDFVKAKQACDNFEVLKEMLIEKQDIINELLSQRLYADKSFKALVDSILIAHISDLFKESGEIQQPYCLTHNFSELLDKTIKDPHRVAERRIFRQVNLQLDEVTSLWRSIVENVKKGQIKEEISRIAIERVFGDVDEEFSNINIAVFQPIQAISKVQGVQINLNDLTEYVLPYLQNEILINAHEVLDFDIQNTSTFKAISEYLYQYSGSYSEYEQKIFLSSLKTAALLKQILSFITNLWNPFDLSQTKRLYTYIKAFIDSIYVSSPADTLSSDFGLFYSTDLLNCLVALFKQTLDLFHLTPTTVCTLSLLNGIESLITSILVFQDLLPKSSLYTLLIDQLLIGNFLKVLGKRLHKKVFVESQGAGYDEVQVQNERQRAQMAYELLMGQGSQIKEWLGSDIDEEQYQKVDNVLRELGVKGLKME